MPLKKIIYTYVSINPETADLDTFSHIMMDRMDDILNQAIREKKVCYSSAIKSLLFVL